MESIKDLLLINSLDLDHMMEKYRTFFLALMPSIFIIATIVEYFDRMEAFELVKRAVISILILSSIPMIYHKAIDFSLEAADEMLKTQKRKNPLLMNMFKMADTLQGLDDTKKGFYQDKGPLEGTLSFLKFHLFDAPVNDIFTKAIFFITTNCFLILKAVYSLVFYLGYGLSGIPCLIYLFPSMGNVFRGGIMSFLWCLVVPHILVFILSIIGHEINRGYVSGQIIGGSMMGTALLFILSIFVAFTPLVATMMLSGSGMAQAGGIIAAMGASYITSLPRHMLRIPKNALNSMARVATGGSLGPKSKLMAMASGTYKMARPTNALAANDKQYNRSTREKRESYQTKNKGGENGKNHNQNWQVQRHGGVRSGDQRAYSDYRRTRNNRATRPPLSGLSNKKRRR